MGEAVGARRRAGVRKSMKVQRTAKAPVHTSPAAAGRQKPRLAIVVSHPIQHFVPFYRALTRDGEVDPTVIYGSRIGLDPYFDEAMNSTIVWKMDLLSGYDHVFLPDAERVSRTGLFDLNSAAVADELNRQAPDVVLVYGYNQLTSLRALWWGRRNKIPVMMISDSELKYSRSRKVELAKRLVVPFLLRQFDAFLTIGDCNEEYYERYGVARRKFFRSPFTIDEERYAAARKSRPELRRKVRSQLSIGESDVVALTVGKLSKRKRPRDILSVARRLKANASDLNLTFVLAGNGSELEAIGRAVEDEGLPIRLTGFINVDELPSYYAAADLLLHPSSNDPHPLVMSEAAAMGLPLVISDRVGAAGPTDVARPGENALVYPMGDLETLAAELRRLAANPARLSAMAARSLDIFEEVNMSRSVRGAVAAVRFCTERRR
jgi:glycosyltransferase involved in cell wall biosynthesis